VESPETQTKEATNPEVRIDTTTSHTSNTEENKKGVEGEGRTTIRACFSQTRCPINKVNTPEKVLLVGLKTMSSYRR
jgi:hypothetical protein